VINADASEVASDLETYLRKAQNGETVVISIQNQPVAELRATVAPPTATPRPFGLCAGEFVVPDDFDAPLPDDIIADFEGR
jgi:antitoxin (DNA-binding transcriptional repressor) of toxin-antitoxin stability system